MLPPPPVVGVSKGVMVWREIVAIVLSRHRISSRYLTGAPVGGSGAEARKMQAPPVPHRMRGWVQSKRARAAAGVRVRVYGWGRVG